MRCNLCPRMCNVDRVNERGFCNAPDEMYIAKAYLHNWEEPCLSGDIGSGTIFFSYCNLKCIFCQNYDISINNFGYKVSIDMFADICIK